MALLDQFNPGPFVSPILAAHLKHRAYAIIHFGLNTFTDREWGYGDESPELFNPTDFDADQIVQACVDGGLSGLILVCKHHDGFCLWPTKTTTHNISAAPFRGGRGDLVRDFADACRRHGVAFGAYVSPWDRNHPAYGTAAYLQIYREQLREICTGYGELFEVWFDGANGGDGYYGGARETRKIDQSTYYDWANTWKIVRELQPLAAIFSDVGPDLRWVGNEKGLAAPEASALFTPVAAVPGKEPAPGFLDYSRSTIGDPDGAYCLPPECDVPLRPGWFYHASQDGQVRSVQELVKIYLRSIGCGGFLNLGLAPDRRGRLHANDVLRLKEFRQALRSISRDERNRQALALQCGVPQVIEYCNPLTVNAIELQEASCPRQTELIQEYLVEAQTADGWVPLVSGKAVGLRRVKTFPTVTARRFRLTLRKIRQIPQPDAHCDFQPMAIPAELLAEVPLSPLLPPGAVTLPLARDAAPTQTWELEQPLAIQGFLFVPGADRAASLPSHYRFEVQTGGQWRCAAEGEFSNIQANPLPQTVTFPPLKAEAVRFAATRLVDGGDRMNCDGFHLLT